MSLPGSGSGTRGRRGTSPIPRSIDHYQIQRRIGTGGQGEVLLGHDPNFDIPVAVKVLHKDFRSEEVVNRFQIEARTTVRLSAPNIVRVYAFNPNGQAVYTDGSVQECPYLVMEYCGDGDLNRMIKSRRPLTLRESVAIVRQVAEALVVAHSHDPPILHRDLKPGNVLFKGNVPKVADFGLAKMLGGASTGLTTTRGMMGTVGYASPEQLKDASKVDHRTDLWSLGVVMYELLTFRRPFQKSGDDYLNVAIKVRMEPPAAPPFDLPPPARELIQRLLQKEPDDRISSAREIVDGLDKLLVQVPNAARVEFPPAGALSELERLAADAASKLSAGQTDTAAGVVESMRGLDPNNTLPDYWSRQLREAREIEASSGTGATVTTGKRQEAEELERRLKSIQSLIGGYKFTGALKQVGELLALHPDNTVVQDFITRINQARSKLEAALNEAHEKADAAQAAANIQEVHRIWKEMDERFPDYPDIQAELAVAMGQVEQEKVKKLRENARRTAEKMVEANDFPGAVAVWDNYLAEHPSDSKALTQRQEFTQRQQVKQREDRIAELGVESRRLHEAGKLDEALSLWEKYLEKDPGAASAVAQTERLRREIHVRNLALEIERARSTAASRTDAGDHRGALDVWLRVKKRFPESSEASRQIETLRNELAERERADLLSRIEKRVANLQARLSAGRYLGLPEARAKVASAIEGAVDAEPTLELLDTLRRADEHAEELVTGGLTERRAALRGKLDEAAEVLSGAGSVEAAASEEVLEQAIERASIALCTSVTQGDPLAPPSAAEEQLREALALHARAQAGAIAAAREQAAQALAAAQAEVESLRQVEAAGPDSRVVASRLAGQLDRIGRQSDSDAIPRLEAVRRNARDVEIEARAATRSTLWALTGALEGARDRAIATVGNIPRENREQLLRSAGDLLDSPLDELAQAAPGIAELARELHARAESAEQHLAEALPPARSRWEQALATWHQVAENAAGDESTGRIEAWKQKVDQAVAANDAQRVQRLAACVEAEADEARVTKVVTSTRTAATALEEVAEESAQLKLLARYRRALAQGTPEEIASVGREVQRMANEAGATKATGARSPRIPAPTRELLAFNRKHHPAAGERFDRALEDHRDARGDSESVELSRLVTEVELAYDALLKPPPAWRRFVPAATAAFLISAVATGMGIVNRPVEASVRLIAEAGDVTVEELFRNGAEVEVPAGNTVAFPDGVSWELLPGEYRARTTGVAELHFDVPSPSAVVVPAVADYEGELVRVMGLNQTDQKH